MAAMRAPVADVIPFRSGRGRQSAAVEASRDARDDLLAHNREALEFIDGIRPLADRLYLVAVEIGPIAMQTVLQLNARIDRYERRHLPSDGDAA